MMVIIIVIVIAILFIVKEQQPEQLVLLFDGSSLNAKRNSIAQTYESTSKDGGHYPFWPQMPRLGGPAEQWASSSFCWNPTGWPLISGALKWPLFYFGSVRDSSDYGVQNTVLSCTNSYSQEMSTQYICFWSLISDTTLPCVIEIEDEVKSGEILIPLSGMHWFVVQCVCERERETKVWRCTITMWPELVILGNSLWNWSLHGQIRAGYLLSVCACMRAFAVCASARARVLGMLAYVPRASVCVH